MLCPFLQFVTSWCMTDVSRPSSLPAPALRHAWSRYVIFLFILGQSPLRNEIGAWEIIFGDWYNMAQFYIYLVLYSSIAHCHVLISPKVSIFKRSHPFPPHLTPILPPSFSLAVCLRLSARLLRHGYISLSNTGYSCRSCIQKGEEPA